MLLPHLAAVVIDGIVRVAGAVEVWARPRAGGATCPECGKRSQRVHSRYKRRLADAAIETSQAACAREIGAQSPTGGVVLLYSPTGACAGDRAIPRRRPATAGV